MGAGLLLMGIMVMTVSVACGDKREKAKSETVKAKSIVNGSESIAETEMVSKAENSKDDGKNLQNTEPAEQINTEQIKPDKTDIQSSPPTENETKNDDEKNNNDEKKGDVMEEENPDYHASGGESDVSDNPADEYNTDEPDNSTHDQDADEPDNDTENYETYDDGHGSGDAKEEKPKVDAGWIYYVSSAKNGMNSEQKAYFDALVGKWTRKEITDADMSDEFLHTFDEWGFDTWTFSLCIRRAISISHLGKALFICRVIFFFISLCPILCWLSVRSIIPIAAAAHHCLPYNRHTHMITAGIIEYRIDRLNSFL